MFKHMAMQHPLARIVGNKRDPNVFPTFHHDRVAPSVVGHRSAGPLIFADMVAVEMDGVRREQFDLIDHFIAKHAINIDMAEQSMNTPALDLARLLVDINVPRSEILDQQRNFIILILRVS